MIEDNQDNDYDTAFRMAIEALKAQLSQEGTTKDATSDLISKTETVEHLRRMLEATVPNTDYDEGFVDGVEFCVSTVSTMPIIQPQSTTGQLNDGARSTVQSTDLIDRQQAIDALDVLCQEHRYRIPGKRETYSEYNEAWQDALDRAEGLIFNLPPVQPEPSIPLSWVEKHIEWLKGLDNEFANLAAAHISVMVRKWRGEQHETD